MSVHTQHALCVRRTSEAWLDDQVNEVSKAREYTGRVVELARAQSSLPHGGQILVDQATLEGIKPHLAELLTSLHDPPGSSPLARLAR